RNWAASEGQNNNSPQWESLASGDILIAAPVTDADDVEVTSWAPENNGVAGDRHGSTGRASDPNNQGPGGREFYHDTQGTADNSDTDRHQEIGLGSVVVAPGATEVVS